MNPLVIFTFLANPFQWVLEQITQAFNGIGVLSAIGAFGLAVIVLGGMGSIPGAVFGGYLLGMIEVLALVALGSGARSGVAFAALFLMLVLRPQGLFGTRLRERI